MAVKQLGGFDAFVQSPWRWRRWKWNLRGENCTIALVDFFVVFDFQFFSFSFAAAAALLSSCCIVPALPVAQPLGASDLVLLFFFICSGLFVFDWLAAFDVLSATNALVFSQSMQLTSWSYSEVLVAAEVARSSNTPKLSVHCYANSSKCSSH